MIFIVLATFSYLFSRHRVRKQSSVRWNKVTVNKAWSWSWVINSLLFGTIYSHNLSYLACHSLTKGRGTQTRTVFKYSLPNMKCSFFNSSSKFRVNKLPLKPRKSAFGSCFFISRDVSQKLILNIRSFIVLVELCDREQWTFLVQHQIISITLKNINLGWNTRHLHFSTDYWMQINICHLACDSSELKDLQKSRDKRSLFLFVVSPFDYLRLVHFSVSWHEIITGLFFHYRQLKYFLFSIKWRISWFVNDEQRLKS